MLLKLAWRNLWRNRKRTFITMFSIIFAMQINLLASIWWKTLLINGFIKGFYDRQNLFKIYSKSHNQQRQAAVSCKLSVWIPAEDSEGGIRLPYLHSLFTEHKAKKITTEINVIQAPIAFTNVTRWVQVETFDWFMIFVCCIFIAYL